MRRPTVARVLPAAGWLPRYERRWLRGDLAAGIAVTALIVPKDLGYAGIAGVPLQNGLYAAAAGAIVYALFCTSRQISTGPSSSLAAVAGGAVVAASIAGDQAAELVAAIAIVTGLLFLALGAAADGVDLALPLEGGRHRIPGGGRGRRGHRRALQAHGDRRRGGERVARARLVARLARRRALGDGGGGRARAGADPRAAVPRPGRAGRARARGGGDPRRRPAGPRRAWRRAGRRRAERAAVAGAARLRARQGARRDDPGGVVRAGADRLLADRRRRSGVRRPASVPHRRRPGVRGAGHGQRRRGRLPGHAGFDEPLGELAQRVCRREDADGLADHRRPRPPDAARSSRRCSRTCRRRSWAR